MESHIHTGALTALYIAAVATLLLVLPKTWATHHPGPGLSDAILYIYG